MRAALLLAFTVAHSALALDPARTLSQYIHDSWGTREGLPQATVRAIVQTRDGYLWLGTEEGVARFDGVRFAVFNRRTAPALRDNHILSMLEDRAGRLWIGTHGGGLTRFELGGFTTLTDADGLPSNFIYALHEDRDGTLWIGGRRGVSQMRGGRLTRFADQNLVGGASWSIRQDRDGAVWIGSDLYGISRVADRVVRTYARPRAIPVMRQLRDGRLIAGTNGDGLFEWDGRAFIPFRAKGTLPGNAIGALLEDSAGNLWIGTDRGLARCANGAIVAGAPGPLGEAAIHALAEDREGNLWIGTAGAGLHRLRDGKVHTLTTADGLPDDAVRAIFHDREGATWIGTRNGAARRSPDGRVATYSTRNGLPHDSVKSIFQSSDGAIWLGTDLGGVVQIRGGAMKTTVLDPEVPDNTIRAFAEQPGLGVWVGSNGGRLTLFENGVPTRRVEAGGRMPRLFVRAMIADRNSLWLATDGNGLVHLVDGKFRRTYTERDGLSRNSLRSLHLDRDGTLWIGTDGGGLNRFRDGRFTAFGTREGLHDGLVLQILEDDAGRLWMSSNNGIFAANKRDLSPVLALDHRDGMPSRECAGGSQPAGAKSADGRLWFPTNAGVVIVDPRGFRRNAQPPPVHVESVSAERVPVAGVAAFELPPGTKNVEIAYTAPSLVVPERVRFRYKLEGYDDDWTDAGARRTAYYTALRPGRYRFRVTAANDDGVWNERGASVAVTLPPYFWQRRSFLFLMLALAAAAVWAAVAWRIRSIRAEAARSAEVERRLVTAQRMDALGQMASGIAHDFNNTLMAAYPWAEMIQRRYPADAMLQQAADRIMSAVERAKKVTSQLLDFAQPKHEAFTPVDVTECARQALTIARAVMPREIDVRLRGDERVFAMGDEAGIGQVLFNLLLNARDAMPHGGRVDVEVRAGDMVELSVSDTGTGMTDDVRARIFDPFFTTKGVGKGTGLGLAVAHRIVRDYRGSISVESAPGAGSTFKVLLPRADEPAAAREPSPVVTPTASLGGKHVLLVDDEAVIVEIVASQLRDEGMTVDVATTGAEALGRLDGGLRPDLVILDLGLPEMSGERVHALIRERLPELPIVISSGYGDHDRLDPLLRDGHTAYLQKPFRISALRDLIVRHTMRS